MSFIDNIKSKAKSNIKTIVLPETMDDRVIKAGVMASIEGIANIVFVGNKDNIISKYIDLDFSKVSFVNPDDCVDEYSNKLYEMRKEKGLTLDEARDLITNDYMYLSCMLVVDGKADGVVSGACHSTANTLRPALQIVKTSPSSKLVSSFTLISTKKQDMGSNGCFVFADCGLNQNPTSEELAEISISSAESFKNLVGDEARVAMLSHSTKGSASHADVDKVRTAKEILDTRVVDFLYDGELQLDAAIVREVANMKALDSKIAGNANVLVFPDLDAGNIGYKLVERFADAEAYGPITQGIRKPINDLSRGCSVNDIIGAIAITAVQASYEK